MKNIDQNVGDISLNARVTDLETNSDSQWVIFGNIDMWIF